MVDALNMRLNQSSNTPKISVPLAVVVKVGAVPPANDRSSLPNKQACVIQHRLGESPQRLLDAWR